MEKINFDTEWLENSNKHKFLRIFLELLLENSDLVDRAPQNAPNPPPKRPKRIIEFWT